MDPSLREKYKIAMEQYRKNKPFLVRGMIFMRNSIMLKLPAHLTLEF
ncbi:MAG: hypothetical protein WA799_04990 [Nitrosotalea sp.]